MIEIVKKSNSTRKPPRIIGLDIGGTNIRGILYRDGKIIRKREVKTPQNLVDFGKVLRITVKFLARAEKISGIGIGTAGVVNGAVLRFSPNIPAVKNFNFQKIIPTGIQLKLDNDARCFARGEYLLGFGRGFKNLFFLTIGTGIGRASGRNGKILKIKKFEYPERWEGEYQKIRDRKDDMKLAEFLGKNLAKLIKPYKPRAIIIGGGVIMKRKNFISKLKKELTKNGIKAKILKSRLGNHAASLGAALLFK
ncbi:MAG: ROK family protein [Candidatus Niyogibacteria bacterium]|nr:MAG: ROK family protein [Candidatus Niyogibacteria bacterium]